MVRVIEPKMLQERQQHRTNKHKKQHRRHVLSIGIVLVVSVYVLTVLVVPLPLLQASTGAVKVTRGAPVSMPWPTYGQAAVGAVGYGLLDQHGDPKQLPIASVAKVITAVAVLKVKPIAPGQSGEAIMITPADEAMYYRYISEGQSSVAVTAGETWTQYQALQALMLPSANNMADILARWAFGSTENYLAFVNPFTKSIGMTNTVVADASGYNPGTMSTAADLAKLAEIAMNNPMLAEIAGQSEANLPTAGRVFNVNNLLGSNGIVGIKTGTTDEAGGCYMFAAKRAIDGDHSVTVVGVIIGAPTRVQAMNDSVAIIDEMYKGFRVQTPVTTGQVVGELSQSSGAKAPVTIKQGLAVVMWADQAARVVIEEKTLGRHVNAGDQVGVMHIYVGSMEYDVTLVSGGTIKDHSMLWRLRHGAGYL